MVSASRMRRTILRSVPLFVLQAIEITDRFTRNASFSNLLHFGSLSFFSADYGQLTGVEPITSTVGTFIDLHLSFGAEEMPLEIYPRAARTLTYASLVADHPFVVLHAQ